MHVKKFEEFLLLESNGSEIKIVLNIIDRFHSNLGFKKINYYDLDYKEIEADMDFDQVPIEILKRYGSYQEWLRSFFEVKNGGSPEKYLYQIPINDGSDFVRSFVIVYQSERTGGFSVTLLTTVDGNNSLYTFQQTSVNTAEDLVSLGKRLQKEFNIR